MTKGRDRPKFVLVDSSISGSGGHYLEYAEQVFEAAQAAGFVCVLVANTAFRAGAPPGVTVFPVLPLDMWGTNLALRHDSDNAFTEDDRRFLRLNFGRMGTLWAAANNLEAVREYAREVPLSKTAAKNLALFARLSRAVEQRYRAILAAESSERIPSSHAEERRQRYGALRQAIREVSHRHAAGPGAFEPDAAGDLYQHGARADAYARAIAAVLRQAGVGADDTIFVPTLSFSEATAIRNLLARCEMARAPTWCLLFRRDVYRGYSPDWDGQEWSVHALRNLFASFGHVAQDARIKFLCDTEELSRQYRNFQAGPFTTVAIPVRTRALAGTRPPVPGRVHDGEARVEILYRRDTRFEHGFDYLSSILEALPHDLLGRVRLSASRAASAPPSGGDARAGTLARARLRPYEVDCYREIPEPQLRLDGWRAAMRLFQIAVFIEPRGASPSQLVDELDAAASAGAIVIMPQEAALAAAYRGTLARQYPHSRAFYFAEGNDSSATARNIGAALRDAVTFCLEQPRRPPEELDCWRIGYLGDAREEKGFALLPHIHRRLAMQVVGGRPVRIAAQGYQTGTSIDVEMLMGIDELLRSTGDGTVVVEEPLPPDRYGAMLARSDIVYNLYKRENYTARSSGVFVEAIACRKPVVTTAGTWMSAVMGAHAAAYHRDTIDPARVVSEAMMAGTDLRWREIGTENGKLIDREIPPGGTARISEKLGAYHVFSRPDRANQLWIELSVDSPHPDICVHVTLSWRGANPGSIRERRVVLNRLGSGSLSVVLDVPRICEDLWLGLNLAHTPIAVELGWLRLRWIDQSGVAFLPGGMIVEEAAVAPMADAAVAAINTILAGYDAYRQSCEWLARNWADAQNADRLVAALAEAPAVSSQSRFSGSDW